MNNAPLRFFLNLPQEKHTKSSAQTALISPG